MRQRVGDGYICLSGTARIEPTDYPQRQSMTGPWLFPESAKGLSRCPPKNAPLRIRLIHTLGHEIFCSYERRKAHRPPSICHPVLPDRSIARSAQTPSRLVLDPISPRERRPLWPIRESRDRGQAWAPDLPNDRSRHSSRQSGQRFAAHRGRRPA